MAGCRRVERNLNWKSEWLRSHCFVLGHKSSSGRTYHSFTALKDELGVSSITFVYGMGRAAVAAPEGRDTSRHLCKSLQLTLGRDKFLPHSGAREGPCTCSAIVAVIHSKNYKTSEPRELAYQQGGGQS